MPRVCTVCAHPQRQEIDECLVSGQSNRGIARQFGVDDMAVSRHRNAHLPAQVAQAHKAREIARADTLLGRIETLYRKAVRILERGETEGGHRGQMRALAAIREARETVELLAKMAGELTGDGMTVNILVNPQWVTLQTAILNALEPYPQAKDAVSRALLSLDGGRD